MEPMLNTGPPNLWVFLAILVGTIPAIITALATFRKTKENAVKIDDALGKLDTVNDQVNGVQADALDRSDYLAYRLSKYENIPQYYRRDSYEGNPEPGGGDSGRGDASGPGSEQGRDAGPVQRDLGPVADEHQRPTGEAIN